MVSKDTASIHSQQLLLDTGQSLATGCLLQLVVHAGLSAVSSMPQVIHVAMSSVLKCEAGPADSKVPGVRDIKVSLSVQ